MRMKRSEALVFTPGEGQFLAYNFLTKSVFECGPDLLAFLTGLDDWAGPEDMADKLPDFSADERRDVLDGLISVGALIVEQTPEAARESEYAQSWGWGLVQPSEHLEPSSHAISGHGAGPWWGQSLVDI